MLPTQRPPRNALWPAANGFRRAAERNLSTTGKPIAPNTVLAAIRQENKREKIHAVSTAAFSSEGLFGTVVIDPPSPMTNIERDVRPNQVAFDYPTMNEDVLRKFSEGARCDAHDGSK
jgi:hypothetical protein